MRKKPRGQPNVRRGERKKKTTWHKLLEQKCTKKLKIVATEKRVWGISKRKKDNDVKTHEINKKLRFW